jgi:GNAT superfamily N-acetyltransferase
MDETEDLIRLCCRALVAQMSAAPGFELHMTQNCVLGLTGEPSSDSNMLTLGPDPDAEGFLVRSVARARERGVGLSAMMTPHVAEALTPVATRLGLTPVGKASLMVLRPETPLETPVRLGRGVRIDRALGSERVGIAGDIIAAAFEAPRDVIARSIEVGITETSGVETYIAWGDEGPMSTVSLTPTGNTAGITLMGTTPAHQRKGMGRALLTQVLDDYRRRGVDRFYLGTSGAAGFYAGFGFETVAELSAWLLEN